MIARRGMGTSPRGTGTGRWRRRTALLLVGAAVTMATPAAAAQVPGRGLWVWDLPAPDELTAFAVAHHVSTVYLAVPPDLVSSPALPQVRQVVTTARAAGLRVEALGGDPGWLDDPSWAVTHWVTPTLATGLFDGLHLDVEPYGNPTWSTDRTGTVKRYLSLLSAVVKQAGPRPVEADVAFWFSTVPVGRTSTLAEQVLTRVAGVDVMTYRTTATGPDGALALAAPVLASAASAGKLARVGQETNFLGSDPLQTKQTFFGLGAAALDEQLAALETSLTGRAGFGGVSVEDSTGWSRLAP